MILYTENFQIIYSTQCEHLANQLLKILQFNLERILKFFCLEHLKKRKQIIIYDNISIYAAYVEQSGRLYHEWMIEDTFNGDINILSLSC